MSSTVATRGPSLRQLRSRRHERLARRDPSDGRPAAVPAGDLDWRRSSARSRRRARRNRSARAKSEIALAELDRLVAAGVRFGTVLADAGYGMGAEFRQALSARGLAWAVGIPRHQKVYPRDVELVFPVAARGRPRKRHVPNVLSASAEDMLTQAKWRTLAWRKGTIF